MGPYKCPDCGVWWAAPEHRCPPTLTVTSTGLDALTWDTLSASGGLWSCTPCRAWHSERVCPRYGIPYATASPTTPQGMV